jgi:hypothetical protein
MVTSRPFFLKMPASLASVSGAKPVQPDMPMATLVSCAPTVPDSPAATANTPAANANFNMGLSLICDDFSYRGTSKPRATSRHS